jgi:hypothetical protein
MEYIQAMEVIIRTIIIRTIIIIRIIIITLIIRTITTIIRTTHMAIIADIDEHTGAKGAYLWGPFAFWLIRTRVLLQCFKKYNHKT